MQIIPGSLYGYKEVSCIDCCDSDGKVHLQYSIFHSKLTTHCKEKILHGCT